MQTVRTPYEFLVRWNQGGELSGAHVVWLYTVKDGDTVLSQLESKPMTVALGQGEGYPLADILSEVQASAITAAQDAQAALAAAEQQIETLIAQRDAFAARIEALETAQ